MTRHCRHHASAKRSYLASALVCLALLSWVVGCRREESTSAPVESMKTCVEDKDCGPGRECVVGVCRPSAPPLGPQAIVCAVGAPTLDCECRPPLRSKGGLCVRSGGDPRCDDPAFLRLRTRLVAETWTPLNETQGNRWQDFVKSDATVTALLTQFSDHVALLFPKAQPLANADTEWPPPAMGARYEALIERHFDTLFNAKLLVALGRASKARNQAERQINNMLAIYRVNQAKAWLKDVCLRKKSRGECDQLRSRFRVVAISEDRPIRLSEFRDAVQSQVREGGQVHTEARWWLAEDDGGFTTNSSIMERGRPKRRRNGTKPANIQRLKRALQGSRAFNDRWAAEVLVNRAVIFVPIPCAVTIVGS